MMEEPCRSRWGDLPIIPDTESGIAAIEREQITKPRPVEISGPPLHQPSKGETPLIYLSQDQCSIDNLTLHTIQLFQHAKKLRSLIQGVQHSLQEGISDGESSGNPILPVIPPFPEGMPQMQRVLDMSGENTNSFVLGQGKSPPALNITSSKALLSKGVAAICAHAGYDASTESVLSSLTDVTHEYFIRICSLLRTAADREAITGTSNFVDAIESVFHEIGLGSITNLHEFYQSRIIQYHGHMLKTCQQLEIEYELLKVPQKNNLSDIKNFKLKEDLLSDIHFPVSEEETDLRGSDEPQTPPHLEELQDLDGSAEEWLTTQGNKKEEQNQNTSLDADEEIINVSDSPSLGEMEISPSPSSDTKSPTGNKPPKKKSRH